MKKRLKGLICFWMAIIMIAATLPMSALAGSADAKTFLVEEVDADNYSFEYLGGDETSYSFELGTALNEQDTIMDAVDAVTPDGYELDGWNLWTGSLGSAGVLSLDYFKGSSKLDADGFVSEDDYSDVSAYPDYYAIALEPFYKLKTFTVIWENYDGAELEKDEDVPYGTLPTYDGVTPEKAADAEYTYTFDGWTPDVEEVTGDVTYTAIYTTNTNTYTVIWENYDGAELEKDEDVPYGTLPTYDSATPEKAADAEYTYTFDGWTPDIEEVTGDVTYSATYTQTPIETVYTVTFETNGGSTVDEAEVEEGNTVRKPSNPTRSGYRFGGWYTDTELDNKYDFDTPVTQSFTLYAKWTRKSTGGGGGMVSETRYTVKFETNSESIVNDKTVVRNTTVAKPYDPKKEGYTFDGWYTDKELTTAYDFEEKVTKDFTLYAKWLEKEPEKEPEKDTDGKDDGASTEHNCYSKLFDDLDITKWYHLDADYVIEKDLFKGVAKNEFDPDGKITRAMMITVLYRAEGEPEVKENATFEDVAENAYYAKAVAWGQKNGIIKGYSEREFAPNADILREQIAAIMHRYAQYKGYDVSVGENTNILSYEDYDKISEYAIPAMQWAVGSGMINGRTEKTLNPKDTATRIEIAAMLHRFIESNK